MNPALIELGQRVRRCRQGLGLSQGGLAQRCSFDRTYISLIERGQRNPSLTNLLRLSSGLETPITELLKEL